MSVCTCSHEYNDHSELNPYPGAPRGCDTLGCPCRCFTDEEAFEGRLPVGYPSILDIRPPHANITRPPGLDSGIAIQKGLELEMQDHLSAWLAHAAGWIDHAAGEGTLFGLDRSKPVRLSDPVPLEPNNDPERATDLEYALFKTDPDVIAHVTRNAETGEGPRFENGLCTAYVRACEGLAPESAWMTRAAVRMRAMMERGFR